MKTLTTLWQDCGRLSGHRFRFIDWNYKTRYFIAKKESEDGSHLEGELDCGTEMSFPMTSDFWDEYQEGDEHSPKAV